MVGRGGLSCSFAFNGNSAFCLCVFNTNAKALQPQLTRAEPHIVFLIQSSCILKKRLEQKFNLFFIWAGVDSNHRSLATADLQSAPFSHSGTYPCDWY